MHELSQAQDSLIGPFGHFNWFTIAIAAGLLLLAVVIVAQTLLSTFQGRISPRSLKNGLISSWWLLPVLGGFALVATPALHRQSSIQVGQSYVTDTRSEQSPAPGDTAEGEAEERAEPLLDEESADTSTSSRKLNFGPEAPIWVHRDHERDGETLWLTLHSKQYATIDEADEEIFAQAVELVQTDFEEHQPAVASWNIPAEVVRTAAIRERYVSESTHDFGSISSPMYRVSLLLEISPEVRDRISPVWREHVVTQRLRGLGGVLSWLTLAFATAWAYLRLDLLTQGRHRFRLKFASVSVILAGALIVAAFLSP